MSIRAKSLAAVAVCALIAATAPAAHAEPSGIQYVGPRDVEIGVPFELKFDLRNAAVGTYYYDGTWCQEAIGLRYADGRPGTPPGIFEHTGRFDFISWEVVVIDFGETYEQHPWSCELENEAPYPYADLWWGITVHHPGEIYWDWQEPWYPIEPGSDPLDISGASATPTAVRFDLNRRASIRARVRDPSGDVVHRASFHRNAGTRHWKWNPREMFKPGRYRIALVATDNAGGRDVARTSIRIRR